MRIQKLSTSILLLLPSAVFAHTGTGITHSFMDGLAHPWLGSDHLLVMFGIGLWACVLGGRMLWALPVSFLAFMAVGAGLGFAGLEIHAAEQWVAASVVGVGLVLWRNLRPSNTLAICLVAAFALGHGYVHAAELNNGGDPSAYALGFLVATALLHGLGIGSGLLGAKTVNLLRISLGLVCTAVGVVLLAG